MAQNSNVFNISLDQYASFNMTLQIMDSASLPVNIDSWTFTGSIKQSYSKLTPIATFSVELVNSASAMVLFGLSPADTGLLHRPSYVYDIIATTILPDNAEQVYRVLEGQVFSTPGVTPSPVTSSLP